MAGDYTSWYVGMEVVCVEGAGPDEPPPNPIVGAVYTISWIGLDPVGRDMTCINLLELPAPIPTNPHDWGLYMPRSFRPVQTRKTDISIFTAMLRPIDAKLKETV